MDNRTKVRLLLDALYEAHAQRDALALREAAAINTVLTPEIISQIDAIKLEFASQHDAVIANIAELETTIKTGVLEYGETIKSTSMQAVWAKGRVSWDTKRLDGYAAAHPEIAQFRNVGDPSVSIRRVNGK